MNLYFIVYVFSIIYLLVPVIKIIWNNKMSDGLLFLLLSNYILLFMLSILFSYDRNLVLSLLLSFTLMIFSYLLIRCIKGTTGSLKILSLPYFFFTVFTFSSILSLL